MKDAQSPSQRLLRDFIPVMEKEGFAYRKSGHRFVMRFDHGTYEYHVGFDARAGLTQVDAAFQVHYDSLERLFKRVVNFEPCWTAGATLHRAGASPWKVPLCDERFFGTTAKERAGLASKVIHPPAKIAEACDFLIAGYKKYAAPLFGRLATYRDLSEFFRETRLARFGDRDMWHPDPRNAWNEIRRCWGGARAEFCVYLALFVAAYLGDDLGEIVEFSKKCNSSIPGRSVAEIVEAILSFVRTTDCSKLLR